MEVHRQAIAFHLIIFQVRGAGNIYLAPITPIDGRHLSLHFLHIFHPPDKKNYVQ